MSFLFWKFQKKKKVGIEHRKLKCYAPDMSHSPWLFSFRKPKKYEMSNKNVGAEKLAKDTVAYQQYKEPVNNKGQFDWKKQTKEFLFKKNRR